MSCTGATGPLGVHSHRSSPLSHRQLSHGVLNTTIDFDLLSDGFNVLQCVSPSSCFQSSFNCVVQVAFKDGVHVDKYESVLLLVTCCYFEALFA